MEIRAALRRAGERDERCVLATLVRTRGSTYRKVGARMLIGPRGETTGLLSGGCLEATIAERGLAAMARERVELMQLDMSAPGDGIWGHGVGCPGGLEILLEPLPQGLTPVAADALLGWNDGETSVVVATIIGASAADGDALGHRHWYADDPAAVPFARLSHGPRASLWPTLTTLAAAARAAGASQVHDGLGPHGSLSVLFEIVPPRLGLTVFGAGPDAVPVVRLANELGWRARVVDHRPKFVEGFAALDLADVVHAAPEQAAKHAFLGPTAAAVIMTHNYGVDLRLLETLLPAPLAYLGLLGARRRRDQLLVDLASGEHGPQYAPTPEDRARFFAPVGLRLGGDTPEAIALCICAEIQARLGRIEIRHLREDPDPASDAPRR
jgi:xanthine/CO dehydrogenase XdhC/CoxF family maturation factor